MTKYFSPAAWLIIVAASCTRPAENKEQQTDTPQDHCYQYVSPEDSIHLSMRTKGDSITGSLSIYPREKDRNTGTFKGAFRGDTLLADYTFMSEGVISVRQVIFLRKEDMLLEGYGETDSLGRFTDLNAIRFIPETPLKITDCPPLDD